MRIQSCQKLKTTLNKMLECMRFFLNFVPRAIEEENYIKKEYDPESRFRFIRTPSLFFSTFMTYCLISITPHVL